MVRKSSCSTLGISPLIPEALGHHALPLRASLFTTFLCILFGANAVAIKISLTGLGVFTNAGMRFGIAALVIYLWARYTGKPLAVKRNQVHQLVILAMFFFVQLSLFYFGQNKTTASHGTLITNVLPFVVMILAHYCIPGDTINLRKVSGLVLGFAGVLVLFFDHTVLTGDALRGDLFILLAVLVWGCHVVYMKKVIEGFHPIQVTLYPVSLAAPLFLLSGFLWDGEMVRFIDASIIKAMLYQTLVTAAFGFVAWNTMIQKFGATALHSFVFIMPVSGVFLGVTLLGEPVTANLICAIVLVVTGLIVVNRVSRNRLPR
ncbi:DMT family transporter [Desulfopila sp. IMCC35006]|uniref:DMT family transporter n=1 Tax=Desulfopila sp. IMCC35006 TaxID=2569542 RepID=UPI001F0E6578|nr:DMT family transporter [Desulfopila sp. IMCC35006]